MNVSTTVELLELERQSVAAVSSSPGRGRGPRVRRRLPTWLHVPATEPPWPLVVFVHGWMGHPRKFGRLFGRWTAGGAAVAAAAFPFTNDESPAPEFDDVADQPADVTFLLDRLLEDDRLDAGRVAVAGFSLGAITTLAVAFAPEPDPRPRGAVAVAGRLPWFAPAAPRPLPLLLVHGRLDPQVPYAEGAEAYRFAPGPKALVTVDHPGHHEWVEDEPVTPADWLVDEATAAFLDVVLHDRPATRPRLDPAYARIESEGVW